MLNKKTTALLLIDVQNGFNDSYWGKRNNLQAEENIAKLLQFCRENDYSIFHIQHLSKESVSPLRPDQPGVHFMDFASPGKGEQIFQKHVNSAFIGTELETTLKQNNIDTLIIVGISTDHCVSTSTRMAGNLGFKTYVIADATFTFDRTGYDGTNYPADLVHEIALASLHNEFASVVETDRFIRWITAKNA